jgi:predicted  nucleic acid-binding Zn ribbon protein
MHSLSIEYDQSIPRDAIWHCFNSLLGSLRQNGQLIGRDMHPFAHGGRMSATIFTFTERALDVRYHNDYVRGDILALEALCRNPLEVRYLGASESEVACECGTRPYFIMTGFHAFSPIVCGSCGHEVPLFELPKLHDHGYWTLLGWDNNYRACVILDVNCAVGEQWAIKQQCNHDSALSKQGRGVAARLAELAKTPVYYYLPTFIRRTGPKGSLRQCPSCQGAWHLTTEIHGRIRNKCDTCYLVASDYNR